MLSMSTWFGSLWNRERKRREIAELEELAWVLLVICGTRPLAAIELGRLDMQAVELESGSDA